MDEPIIMHVDRARPFVLGAAVAVRPHQVASMALWRSGADHVALYAFDAGEGVSRETLEEDRLYVVVEGDMRMEVEGKRQPLRKGECLCVPARAEHSLESLAAGKALIVTVGEDHINRRQHNCSAPANVHDILNAPLAHHDAGFDIFHRRQHSCSAPANVHDISNAPLAHHDAGFDIFHRRNAMAQDLIKNIVKSEAVVLKDLAGYEKGQVTSLTLAQKDNLTVTVFAFDGGTGIGGHASTGDAMVYVLEGEARITIGGDAHAVKAGEAIVMPAGIPHALDAEAGRFKMLLVVVKP